MSRTLVLWCPDWPVVAAGLVDGVATFGPVVVLSANRVVASSAAARAEGIRLGLRKREAQSRCPSVTVVDHDEARDARAFEAVVATVESLAPGVEMIRPGVLALAARGPSRYFGGEERAAEHLVEQVAQRCGVEAQVGIADGTFAAGLAARSGRIVPDEGTPAFLAAFDIAAIGGGRVAGASSRDVLVDLLRRLGIRTLGDFAGLPAADVLARFGFDAALAHRLASGLDERPLAVRSPPPDLDVAEVFEEPIDRVDAAAFAARALAQRLHDRLAGHGLACTRVVIEAVTEHGEELHRTWRHDGLLTAAALGDRVRWQLDGWLTAGARATARYTGAENGDAAGTGALGFSGGRYTGAENGDAAGTGASGFAGGRYGGAAGTGFAGGRYGGAAGTGFAGGRYAGAENGGAAFVGGRYAARPSGGIVRLRLIPDGVIAHAGLQLGLWGDVGEGHERAHRAMVRVQGMLGPDSVVTAVHSGGRDPGDVVRYVPWGDERLPARPADQPWPGRLPPPAPATVLVDPVPVDVLDVAGVRVGVTARLAVTAAPARLVAKAGRVEIVDWAGPWPVDERWWSPEDASRRARFQVALGDGRALLLRLTDGEWAIEAIYD